MALIPRRKPTPVFPASFVPGITVGQEANPFPAPQRLLRKQIMCVIPSRPRRASNDLVQPLLNDMHLTNGILPLRLGNAQLFFQFPDVSVLILLAILQAREC